MRNLLKAFALFGSGNGNGAGGSADWNASEGEAGHVKNRTHYEETTVVNEPLNITWDGNTEGLVSVANMLFKVSDAVLTDEQIKLITEVSFKYGDTIVSKIWSDMVANGMVTEDIVASYGAAYVRKAGAEIHGMIFPEVGIYFNMNGSDYIKAITTTEPVEQTKSIIKKIDKKFLPDSAGRTVLYYDPSAKILYHDEKLTSKVSRDELRVIVMGGMVVLVRSDYEVWYYPTKIDFLARYALVYSHGVSADDIIRFGTSEYSGEE